jgi:hypothetical protein
VTAALGGVVLVAGLVGLAALPWAADDLEDVIVAAGGVRALVVAAWRRVRS